MCIVDTRYVYLIDPDDPKAPKTVLRLGYLRQAPKPPSRLTHSISSFARSLAFSLTAAWLHSPHPTSLTHSAHSLAHFHTHLRMAPQPLLRPLCTPPATPSHPHPLHHTALKPFHLPREIPSYPPAQANPRDAPFGWDAILPHASPVPTRSLARSLARSLVCTDSQSMHGYSSYLPPALPPSKDGLRRTLHQPSACARACRRNRGVQAAARGGAAPTADIRRRVRLPLPSLARF